MLTTPDPTAAVRRLQPHDEAALTQALHADHGYGLFISSNLASYGLASSEVRFWGQFRSVGPAGFHPQPQLMAVLMLAGRNANLFVIGADDPTPLIAIALRERLHFIMGKGQAMERVIQFAPQRVARVETHHFAELPPHRFPAPLAALSSGMIVRRGAPADVDALAQLYFGVTGFEGMSYHQVRMSMMNRLTHLRTYLATQDDVVVAAASTSAEATDAAMIGGVWTATQARGRGISTAVVAALSNELRRERRRPYLFYVVENAPAAHVYAKLGFRVIGDWRVLYCHA